MIGTWQVHRLLLYAQIDAKPAMVLEQGLKFLKNMMSNTDHFIILVAAKIENTYFGIILLDVVLGI
jgi:hypothetical protein